MRAARLKKFLAASTHDVVAWLAGAREQKPKPALLSKDGLWCYTIHVGAGGVAICTHLGNLIYSYANWECNH